MRPLQVNTLCQTLALFSAGNAIADDFHSARYGYTLETPTNWVQVPDDVLQQTMAAMRGTNAKVTLVYDAGFQLDSGETWLAYPYVLVQPIALPQQIDEADFAEMVLTLTGMDVNKIADDSMAPDVRGAISGIQPGQITLDKPKRRYLWEVNMEVTGAGPVRGLVAGHFGRESVVQVAFYSLASDWDRYAKERQAIIDSFRFDADKAYSAKPESRTAQEDVRQFRDGGRKTFSSKGNPKAKGVNFTISYPQSWLASDAERPNIVQKFVSDGGRGLASMMILVNDLGLPPGTVLTVEDQREMFSESEMRSSVPPGATFLDGGLTQIEGIPAGSLDFFMVSERAGIRVASRTWCLNFVGDNKFVQVQFSIGGAATASERELSAQMEQYKPLFKLMANSIVLPDKWKQAATVTTPRSSAGLLPYDDPQLLIITLVISFLITWASGLAPPLLTRYVFVRRPLSRKAATWIAASCSVLFWFAFQALNYSVGEKAGSGVVWIIVFFVARWIMSRGYKQVEVTRALVSAPSGQKGLNHTG